MAKGGLLREKGFQSSEGFVVEVLEEGGAVKGGESSPGGETNVRSAFPESEGSASPGHGDGEPRDEPHHLLSVRGRDSPALPCHHLPARLPGDSTRGQRTPDSSGGEDPCQGEGTPSHAPIFPGNSQNSPASRKEGSLSPDSETSLKEHKAPLGVGRCLLNPRGWRAKASRDKRHGPGPVTVYLLQDKLRTGEKAVVRFRFLKHPEYLKVGAKLLFREGVTKGIGHVTDVQAIAAGEAQANMGF